MKAFQLKITIKNSKPPIWRRVIVPAGITFSQLSMILNKAMGWSGEHLFDIEFYHQQLRITEEADGFEDWGPYDYLEASTTFIREFLEENDWFTYTYDFGDNWEHKVTVEKILSDYELNYPKVIKFKGNCPPEDCGGLYGYYELLDIMEDEDNPEYEDRTDWMEMQDYPNEYDMEQVNEELKKYYFYKWGKAEKRSQQEIFEDHFKGKYGLNATKKDKNKDINSFISDKQTIEEFIHMMADALENNGLDAEMLFDAVSKNNILDNNSYDIDSFWEEMQSPASLQEMFSDYSKAEIVELAKTKGMKGISKYKKDELIEKLADFMLKPEIMEWYFSYLTDKEIDAFEKITDNFREQEKLKLEYLEKLYQASYIGMLTNGVYMTSKEVKEAYALFLKENPEQRRKKNSYLLGCLRTAGLLYGITPLKVIVDMLATNPEIQMNEQDVRNRIENMPPEFNEYVVAGSKVYHKALYPDDKDLLAAQGGIEYYIPTKEEILDMGVMGYLPQAREFKNFVHYLTHKIGLIEKHAECVGMRIQCAIRDGFGMQEIFEIMEEENIYLENKGQLDRVADLLNELWNNTRMLLNRGFTPYELMEKAGERIPIVKENNLISFEKAKKKKIYPNEPCPCGSGKKYKNCCGKK